MNQVTAIYLKKLLTDAGYDQHEQKDDWIIGTSSYYRHSVALKIADLPILALSQTAAMQLNVFENAHFIRIDDAPPDFPYAMALEISELLYWLKKSVRLPFEEPSVITTDVEALVRQRRGQEKLREDLMRYWGSQCAVTGVNTPELLVASHIKPWSQCESSKEKLDVYNALLLNIALDRAFDQGFITFDTMGKIELSPLWSWAEANVLGIYEGMKLRRIEDKHLVYLEFHRKEIWR